ncbi:MAG: amidohydrolase [Chloroflexi bacterium]|nr:MAG: amidohydrolase [Chloroflexota bacterium]
MRIDAHQHFWHYNPAEHAWMTDAMQGLKRDYLPADLQPLLERTGVHGTIAVQARQSAAETDWLLALADKHDFIKGVVGWVDLQAPDLPTQLERYRQQPKLVGVRHVVQDEPDERFMLRPAFLRGLSLLEEFNLAYDLLLFPQHLPIAVEVARQLPQQRFVLDHLAKPLIKSQTMMPWEHDIRALASFPNVYCKVSGMVTEAAWQHWQLDDFARYLAVVFDCFGPDRVMFGSDWPVCTLAASYAEVALIVLDNVRELPPETQDQVLGGNAARFYGVPT